MSDTKPDRILAEKSKNPWVKLILWSNENKGSPTSRWNGFIKHLLELRLADYERLAPTDEQRQALMEPWGIDRAQFKRVLQLSEDELNEAKQFFPDDTVFENIRMDVKIDNHTFSMELNFIKAIFTRLISFNNCEFKSSVEFGYANFENWTEFTDSKFLDNVNFVRAQFRAPVIFQRVTFHEEVDFYCTHNESAFSADFENVRFKKMTPVFHGRKFHPICAFRDVSWPEIPKRNSQNNINTNPDDTLLDQITCYEYIRTQAENIGQLELRKEMIRRELGCRAELAKPSFERLLRKAYGWICDHGTSVGRPALALLGLWFVTFFAWQGWAADEAAITTWDVLYHTGGRMLPLVSGHAYVEEQTLKAIRAAPPALHVLSTIAAVLSPFCLFLMALALRLKFRMSM